MDHQAMLRVVETTDCKQFLDWFENTESQNNLAVKEAVESLSKKELSGIWTVFSKWITDSCTTLTEDPESLDGKLALTTLVAMSHMGLYTLEYVNTNGSEPQTFGASVKAMNKVLSSVSCKKAGNAICQLNEKYWKLHAELELLLCINVIHWYLTQACQEKATAAAIKLVWSVKDSMLKLDAEILESSGILGLLLSCVSNPKFLASSEGRKCIACLFQFGQNIVQMLHEAVKKYIPIASLADCEAIGEVYYKGWRTADSNGKEDTRADVEFSIQDLMYHAVVANRKPVGAVEGGVNKIPMNKLLFHLLHAIHRQKKQRTSAILIYTLYKPILWRYLEASNGLVRANALCLFFDAFPFESGEGIEEDEAVREKQWAIMLTALTDPVPLVRTICIQGTCRVLAEYWELVPVTIIQQFITCMLRKLLYDSSSADVRAHVVKGLSIMLESKQTHLLLEKMIPLTNKILHDPQEKVRAEYVALLTNIQKLKITKLWEVIDVNELVIRLAYDTSKTVCNRLVTLLAPFYHPKSNPEVVFQRCLRLVIDNRVASRKFYQHIHHCIDIQQMTELVLIIWKFLRNYILKQLQQMRQETERQEATARQETQRGRGRGRGRAKRSRRSEPTEAEPSSSVDDDKENHQVSSDSDEGEADSGEELNESTIFGLVDVICILLAENRSKLKTAPNAKFWDNIKARFNKTCSLFFRYFRNSEGLRAIIYLYGLLSSTSSPLMLTYVKSQLKSLDDKATVEEFSHLVDVMCNWNRGEDLMEFISEHVLGSLATEQQLAETSRHSTRGSRKKRVSFQKEADEKPLLGVRCMSYILQNPHNKKIILRMNLPQVEQFCSSLKSALDLVEKDPEKVANSECFLYAASMLYVRIVLVLTSAFKMKNDEQNYAEMQELLIEILDWTKRMISANESMEGLVCEILGAVNNLVMIHSIEWNVCRQFLTLLQHLLESFPNSGNVILALKSVQCVIDYLWSQRSIGNECGMDCDEEITNLVKKVLDCCTAESDEDNEDFLSLEDWAEARDNFRKILELCHRHKLEEHESLRNVVHAFISAMKEELIQYEPNDENPPKSFANLPQTTRAIATAFRVRNPLASMMLDEFFHIFKEEDAADLNDLGAITKLVNALSQDHGKISQATFVQAINRLDQLFSNASEVDKNAKETLAAFIRDAVNDLKVSFKCQ